MKKKVEATIIVCDSCGEHFVNGDGFTCYTDDPDGGNIMSEATSSGWLDIDGRQYCEGCWQYDDDDNIVCSDGRKYNGKTHEPVIKGVNTTDGTAQDGDIIDPALQDLAPLKRLTPSMTGTLGINNNKVTEIFMEE